MEIRIAGTIGESIVDGPGIRYVVFTQGCPHHCPGCHNPQTHSFDGGTVTDTDKLTAQLKANPLLKGITISGGEPFCQPLAAAELALAAHECGKDVMVYTGYTFEQLLSGRVKNAMALLEQTDILVDGRFEETKKSLLLKFKGSSNQRTLNCKESLKFQKAIEMEL
ncbi:MAG: anaerobic ribonucleoside-triphosphate reductase activating protein [Clostridiales bacterium]|nr:anaerobic ribonucleoside-triphosphate reductase activating protein [Clostridiales bacterium]